MSVRGIESVPPVSKTSHIAEYPDSYPQGSVKPIAADGLFSMRAGIVKLRVFTSVSPRPLSVENGMFGGMMKSNLWALSGRSAWRVMAFGDVRNCDQVIFDSRQCLIECQRWQERQVRVIGSRRSSIISQNLLHGLCHANTG